MGAATACWAFVGRADTREEEATSAAARRVCANIVGVIIAYVKFVED